MRSGGGFGESVMGKIHRSSFTFTSEWFGNNEHMCPSGPKPNNNRSNMGNPPSPLGKIASDKLFNSLSYASADFSLAPVFVVYKLSSMACNNWCTSVPRPVSASIQSFPFVSLFSFVFLGFGARSGGRNEIFSARQGFCVAERWSLSRYQQSVFGPFVLLSSVRSTGKTLLKTRQRWWSCSTEMEREREREGKSRDMYYLDSLKKK